MAGSSVAVGDNDLRRALEEALRPRMRAPLRIAQLRRRPSRYRTSFVLEELEVRLADGTTLELIFKDLDRQALHGEARRAKPSFLHDPLREIETYDTLLGPVGLGATFYGAVVDPRIDRYWLFLEKVPGVDLSQVGEVDTWREAARWLAQMHARFSGEIGSLEREARLLRYDGDFYRGWMKRAWTFARKSSRRETGIIERLAARYDQVVERLVALPVTLVHGEFYASNILVERTEAGVRVCPIDWEMAGVGPGLIDLAALTSGNWSEENRASLVHAYEAAAGPGDGEATDAFLALLDYCRLHLAIQWLGWSQEWSPPSEHAHDWLGEAERLAERLGL